DVKDGVNTFAFSRDGKWLAFSAGKATARQIWLVALGNEDAEPVQLTKHATPVRSWSWSPDSSRIFFTAPGRADKDDEKRREKKFDVRIIDEPQPALHLWSAAIADKAEKRWTSGEAYGVATFDVSDDAQWVAFRSASVNRHSGLIDEDTEIYLLSLASGNARRVTNNKMPEGGVSFSPDSRWLLFTASDDFTWGRNSKLYLSAVSGGEPRKLLAEWDHSAAGASWSKDSKTLYFAEGLGVDQHLFAVSVADGKLMQLTRERGVLTGNFDNETGLFLLRFTDPTAPADYYVATPETVGQRARWVRVSNANPQAAQWQLGDYETVRWKASDGQTVEGILVKPVGYEKNKRYPLITQLHGGPASAYTNAFSG
ncbi:MAG: S9 family peptidase, partial [Candidatus Acidiferrales bacterium]